MSSQFEKSPRRWRMLFENWEIWSPLLLFNRETDLITSEDIFEVNSIREKFFPMAKDHPNYKSPPLKGISWHAKFLGRHSLMAGLRILIQFLEKGISPIF